MMQAPPATTISMTLLHADSGTNPLSWQGIADAGCVLVTVRDSGPGFGPHSAEQVFAPFYTTKSTGLGMGLSICRSIIDAHGGRLWASANLPVALSFNSPCPPIQLFHRDLHAAQGCAWVHRCKSGNTEGAATCLPTCGSSA
jgi:signal transduction histidine kinase